MGGLGRPWRGEGGWRWSQLVSSLLCTAATQVHVHALSSLCFRCRRPLCSRAPDAHTYLHRSALIVLVLIGLMPCRAVSCAVGYGEMECAKLLIAAKADVDIKDSNQNTPLHYAAGYGQADSVKLLLDRWAKGCDA